MRIRPRLRFFAGLALCGLLHPAASRAQEPLSLDAPHVFSTKAGKIRVVTVATGLFHPWSLAFTDTHTMLVTERNGRLRIIHDGVLAAEPAWVSPTPPGEGGDALHFVAVHPKFAQNQLVYFSYPKRDGERFTLAVGRGRLSGTKITDVQEIFVADAWETGGNLAGRVFLTQDGYLYVTVGDRDRVCCNGTDDNSLRIKAQSLDNHVGKTLRLRDDGSVPPDNPFVGRAGAKPEIFTYGHRNGYGLAVNPETSELWQAEIGPMGGDEVNILLPGHNYGWPLVSTGRNYTGTLVSDQPWARAGMDNPRMHWVPSISPSSIMFYTGDKFPKWKNNLFVGSLTQEELIRVAFHQPSQAELREGLLAPLEQRVRDVIQGPDGYIYVATEKTFRGNATDGAVLRIEPADQ